MQIKISVPSLLQEFHPCSGDYIQNTCKGRCCQGTGKIMVTVHESEKERILQMGKQYNGEGITMPLKNKPVNNFPNKIF